MTISAYPRLGWLVAASGDRLLAGTGLVAPLSQPGAWRLRIPCCWEAELALVPMDECLRWR